MRLFAATTAGRTPWLHPVRGRDRHWAVNHELEVLLKLAPLQAKLFDRARNRAHAKKLDRALSEVERLLASAPGALAWFLFNPLPPLTLAEEGESVEVMQSI